MSVMMLSQEHTNVMVWAATHFAEGHVFEYQDQLGQWKTTTRERGNDELGQTLADANSAACLLNNPVAYYTPYSYSRPERTDWEAVDILKAIRCYEYQACEVPDWEGSNAQRACQQLAKTVYYRLPGYEDSPWGIESDSIPTAAL